MSYAKTLYNKCENITKLALLCLMVTEFPALNQTNIYADQKKCENVQQLMLKNVTGFSFLKIDSLLMKKASHNL